ncbi:MAG: phage terminase large subunit, partial [Thiohalophilus sp.]|uniref:phage terminase large subunit n=1 Tax=Thiohalophilus sp. TaxID=3028392 RepID=UPI002870271E
RKKQPQKSSTQDLEDQLSAAKRIYAAKKAHDSFEAFMKFIMPDPHDPDDTDKSQFVVKPHHRLLCEALEKVERGELMRLAISIAPQHGKSQIASRGFPSWFMGRNPYRNLMLGTYNQDFANDFGGEIREIMISPQFRQVFPDVGFRKGSKAKEAMITTDKGKMSFIGRGSSGTGKPADIFIIDDPIKNASEADSPAVRKELWDWFTKVAYTRCHAGTPIIVIQTRWSEDDLIGRLCDPDHPDHDPEIAAPWTYINIPALFESEKDKEIADALGVEMGGALWPERFSVDHLKSARKLNPRGFSALYQGRPAPEDGSYFKRENLIGYQPHELPRKEDLAIYGASDHALTTKEENDSNVGGCFGMDKDGVVWIFPDIIWDRIETDELVERMIQQFKHHRPQLWWAENEHISKAIGPFLRQRQKEEKAYTTVVPITASKDIKARARSIQGLMSLNMVRFPKFAPWWQEAENEIIKFPNATHDDFISFLSYIGQGLDSIHSAQPNVVKEGNVYKVGTLGWTKMAAEQQRRNDRLHKMSGGF